MMKNRNYQLMSLTMKLTLTNIKVLEEQKLLAKITMKEMIHLEKTHHKKLEKEELR